MGVSHAILLSCPSPHFPALSTFYLPLAKTPNEKAAWAIYTSGMGKWPMTTINYTVGVQSIETIDFSMQ